MYTRSTKMMCGNKKHLKIHNQPPGRAVLCSCVADDAKQRSISQAESGTLLATCCDTKGFSYSIHVYSIRGRAEEHHSNGITSV